MSFDVACFAPAIVEAIPQIKAALRRGALHSNPPLDLPVPRFGGVELCDNSDERSLSFRVFDLEEVPNKRARLPRAFDVLPAALIYEMASLAVAAWDERAAASATAVPPSRGEDAGSSSQQPDSDSDSDADSERFVFRNTEVDWVRSLAALARGEQPPSSHSLEYILDHVFITQMHFASLTPPPGILPEAYEDTPLPIDALFCLEILRKNRGLMDSCSEHLPNFHQALAALPDLEEEESDSDSESDY